jgi:lipopolysaccharide transport system ATP-binding protein
MSAPAIRAVDLGKLFIVNELRHRRTLSERVGRRLRSAATLGARKEPAAQALPDSLWALSNVSFEVQPGEVLGVIGRNGSGKSTLLKILARITTPSTGYAELAGRVGALLEVGTGFHPDLSGRDNILLNGAILGMTPAEVRAKEAEIIDFAEVHRFVDTPVKHYSSGMFMRLAFAVASSLRSEIMLVDEVLAVGDAGFQEKCKARIREIAEGGGTVLFTSHDMAAVERLCRRVLVLSEGKAVYLGDAAAGIVRYRSLAGR